MAKELPSIGELEIQVLQKIWKLQPCTERQVWDAIRAGRHVGRTTVLKTIQRLEEKELLRRVKGEGPVRFRSKVQPQRVLPQLVRRFVDSVLGGSVDPLVSYLDGAKHLSAEDAQKLAEIAERFAEEDQNE